MFLMDDNYLTMVAFIMGFDAAMGGVLLSGFDDWCQEKLGGGESSLHWSSIIRQKVAEEMSPGKGCGSDVIDMRAKSRLIDMLEQFTDPG